MNASLMGWIITGIILVILVYSVLVGLKRGLGKALFRLVWLLTFTVIIFFLTPVISNALNGVDISSLGIDIFGPVKTLGDIGTNILNNLAETNEVLANSEALKSLAQTLPVMILNIPLFVLLFFIVKWLLWPVWAAISSSIFNKQKKAQKKFKKEQAKLSKENGSQPEEMPLELTIKKKKNGLGGAVVGLLTGFVMCIITFMPVVGLNTIFQNVASIKVTEEDGSQVSLIESQIEDNTILEYLSSYEDSFASKILTYTGVGFVSNAMFGYLTTAEVNEQKISLTNEVSTVSKIYDNVSTLMNADAGELTQQKLDKSLTAVKEILVKVKDSTLINVLGDDLIPLVIDDYLAKEDLFIIDGAEFDELIIDCYHAYSSRFNTRDLENQLENLVDVVSVLNNSNLIVPFANGSVSSLEDVISLVGTNVVTPYNFTNTIVNKLYEVSMLTNSYPELVERCIENLYTSTLNINYNTNIVKPETLKESLKTILTNFVDFAIYFSKSTDLDFGQETHNAFKSLGSTIDVLKNNILTTNNYESLNQYLIDTIDKALIETGEFDTKAVENIKEITKTLSKIESWEEELYSVNTLYSKIIKIVNNKASNEVLLNSDNTLLEEVGEGIESAMNWSSKIITNQNIRRILEVLISKIESSGDETIKDILTMPIQVYNSTEQKTETKHLKNNILDNIYIYSVGGNGYIKANEWTKEFKYNVGVIKKAYKVVTNQISTEDLTKPENTVLQEIGESIDKAIKNKTKLIITNATMRGFVEYVLNNFKENLPENSEIEKILNIFCEGSASITVENQILSNIYSAEHAETKVEAWENEFIKIKSLLANINEDFEVKELTKFGKILDGVLESRIFSQDVLNSIVSYYIDEEVKDFDYLKSGIDEMKKNLKFVTSYEKEFDYILDLLDVVSKPVSENPGDYASDEAKLRAIGKIFNEVSNITQQSSDGGSKILKKEVLNIFMEHFFDEYINSNLAGEDIGLINVVNMIKDNLSNIRNYKSEIGNILNLVKSLSDNATDKNGDGKVDFVDVGFTLDNEIMNKDEVKGSSDLINSNVINELITYFISESTSSITEEDGLYALINQIKESVKEKPISSYHLEFTYLRDLTDKILQESINYTEVGDLLDTIRGKKSGAVPSRIITTDIVNNFIVYYLDEFVKNANFAEEDAKLLDIINGVENDEGIRTGGIKQNVSLISSNSSYKDELAYLEKLFDIVKLSSNSEIAKELDMINGHSVLISKENINYLIAHYFDKEASKYESDYSDILSSMRLKLKAMKNNPVSEYSKVFDDLNIITGAFRELSSISDISLCLNSSATIIGEALDSMEKMTTICDRDLTYQMATIVNNKLLGFTMNGEEETELTLALKTLLNGPKYNFENYNNDDFSCDYITSGGTTYFTSLMQELFTAINS